MCLVQQNILGLKNQLSNSNIFKRNHKPNKKYIKTTSNVLKLSNYTYDIIGPLLTKSLSQSKKVCNIL